MAIKLADAVEVGVGGWREVHAALVPHNERGNPTAGYLFEEFAKYFFLAAPEYKGEFKNVWAEAEIPTRVRKKLTLATRDHGVDLLLEDHEGRFHAVQCKFKTDQSKTLGWTKDRLSSWLAESDEARGLVMFTNASGIDKQSTLKAAKKDFTLVTVGDLLSLSPETAESILRLAQGKAPKKVKRLKPRPHQRRAINDVVKGFKTHDRGQLILPCGAGKTLTSLWLKERLEAKRTLVLVPSLALLRQIRREWAAQQKERLPYLCVCSEKDIDKDKRDTIVTHTFEVPGHVTTQPDEIAEFASKHKELVVYSTYQSLQAVVDAGVKFDLAICDEAHKTATARHNEFALVHEDALKAEKRLYMTATPRVLSPSAKGKLGEDAFDVVADMSDEETFGPEFHRMSFADAIEQGILVDYKIVVVGVSDREVHRHIESRTYLEDASADQVATSLALAKVMKKHGLAHGLTFHSNVKRAKSFSALHKKRTRKTEVGHVNGSMSTNDRLVLLDEFKEAPHAVMTNARCLTEGVDVPVIDCVAFVDPKHSKVDIVQAAGRALRLPRGDDQKPYGVILIPIFYEVGEDPEAVAESGIFKNVFEVVRAMADQDERLQAEITSILLGEGKRGESKSRRIIEPGDEERLVVEGFEKRLRAALVERVVERGVDGWDVKLVALLEYKAAHGGWDVPLDAEWRGVRLGAWVSNLRAEYVQGRLAPARVEQLERIRFPWLREGELEDVSGYLTERDFARRLGVSPWWIQKYRLNGGAVQPVGLRNQVYYYERSALKRLREDQGVTVSDKRGMLSAPQVIRELGVSKTVFYRHLRQGLIKPCGTAFRPRGAGVAPMFQRHRLTELRTHFDVAVDLSGYLNTRELADLFGLGPVAVQRWTKAKIVPFRKGPGCGRMYHPDVVDKLKRHFGITLDRKEVEERGLLPLQRFAELAGVHHSVVRRRVKNKEITTEGRAYGGSHVTWFFRPEQVAEFEDTVASPQETEGCLSERETAEALGVSVSSIAKRRLRGLISPVGTRRQANGSLSYYYAPSTVDKLRGSIKPQIRGAKSAHSAD